MPKRYSVFLALVFACSSLPVAAMDVWLNGKLWGRVSPEELTDRLPGEGDLPLADLLPLMETITLAEAVSSSDRILATGKDAAKLVDTAVLASRQGVIGFVIDGKWFPEPETVYLEGSPMAIRNNTVVVWSIIKDPWLEGEIGTFCRQHGLEADFTIRPRLENDLWALPDGTPLPDLIIMDTGRLPGILRLLPGQVINEGYCPPGHLNRLSVGGSLKAVPLWYVIPLVEASPVPTGTGRVELTGPGILQIDARSFDMIWPLLGFSPGAGDLPVIPLLKNLLADQKDGRLLLPGYRGGQRHDREILWSDKSAGRKNLLPLTGFSWHGIPLKPLAVPLLASAGTPRGAGGRLLTWLTGIPAQGSLDHSAGRYPARSGVLDEQTLERTGIGESEILPPDPWILAWRDYYNKMARLVLSGEMTIEQFEGNRPLPEDFK
jgi:hypothetical protein